MYVCGKKVKFCIDSLKDIQFLAQKKLYFIKINFAQALYV